jgi:PAS domain S-box-containing protein
MPRIKVLAVDDEPSLLGLTKLFLEERRDISVDVATSGKEALGLVQNGDYDIVVSDYQMPGMDGLELLGNLRILDRDLPFILFTGRGREDVAVAALNLGATFYLQKGGSASAQFTELENMILRSAELFRSKKKLRESENRFRNLVQNSSDFILILDPQGMVIYTSSSIKRILGYDDDFLPGKHALGIVHPDHHALALKELDLVNAHAHDGVPTELLVKKADGEYAVVEVVGTNMIGVPGVDGLVITARSINERKKAERALAESEEAYRTLFEKSPFPITLNSLDGTFVDVNEKYLQISGFTKEQIIGKSLAELDIAEPGDLESIFEAMSNDGALYQHPMVVGPSHGKRLNVLVSSRIITYRGETRVLSTINDVTDLVEAKKALQQKNLELDQERGRLQKIADQVPGAVYQLFLGPGDKMEFIFISKGAGDLVHLPRERWMSDFAKVFGRILPEDREPLLVSIRSAAETRGPWTREFRLTDFDGTLRWILGTAVITGEEAGGLIWTGTFIDVTERKRSDEVLRQVNRQLNLMTNITRHDVLNKTMAAEGYIDLASRRSRDEEVNSLLNKAHLSVEAIRSEIELTRDLQDLSSHEAGWQDLDTIFDALTNVPDLRVSRRCHHLEVFANPMLRKVFHNLIDNSVRHGGHATNVALDCHMEGLDLIISYRDDGVGVPLKEKELIFERGYGKNTGMGLFLVREVLSMTHIAIVEIGVEGQGARFDLRVQPGGYRFKGEADTSFRTVQ